jgi:proteic killer suppression protein
MAITKVIISGSTKKDLKKVPIFIAGKLLTWVDAIEIEGIEEVRKCGGYHDEPLFGKRRGQHSIRLNKSYRANTIRNQGREAFINKGEGRFRLNGRKDLLKNWNIPLHNSLPWPLKIICGNQVSKQRFIWRPPRLRPWLKIFLK